MEEMDVLEYVLQKSHVFDEQQAQDRSKYDKNAADPDKSRSPCSEECVT
jgi:hypothetical protein